MCQGTDFTGALSLFVLVFPIPELVKADEDTRDKCLRIVGYWFNAVATHAPGAPVFIVGTRKDELVELACLLSWLRNCFGLLHMHSSVRRATFQRSTKQNPHPQ